MRLHFSIVLVLICVAGAFGQGYQVVEKDIGADVVTVTAVKSNLRDFPSTTARVLTTYPKETRLILVSRSDSDGWYEVANIYTLEKGWMHRSTIQIALTNLKNNCDNASSQPFSPPPPPTNIPKSVSTIVNKDDDSPSPFSAEYVGENFPTTIEVKNNTVKTLNLQFGGVNYVVPSNQSKSIVVEGGTYDFSAMAPGVRALSGQKGFEKGYRYTWTFVIITQRVR